MIDDGTGEGCMRTTPVRFEGLIETRGRNPENAIFKQKRCHIAFGRTWAGEWRPYGLEQYRYLLLCPEPDAQPHWTHHDALCLDKQSEIIPFLNSDSREEWHRRYKPMNQKLPASEA
jgi:hypothetical protein